MTGLNLTSIAIAVVGAVILIAIFRAIAPGRSRCSSGGAADSAHDRRWFRRHHDNTREQTEEVYTVVDKDKVKGKAEQLKGKVEQAVGKATGSEETQARGEVDEAKGKAREKVADVKGEVKAAVKKATA